MVPTAAKFGLAAAAVTAAVVGIGVAVDNYNQKALSSNLEEHFGNIKLSAQEVQDIASGILDQKYLANVEVAQDITTGSMRLLLKIMWNVSLSAKVMQTIWWLEARYPLEMPQL